MMWVVGFDIARGTRFRISAPFEITVMSPKPQEPFLPGHVSRSFFRAGRSTAIVESHLSFARDIGGDPMRDAGWRGGLRRDRALGAPETRFPAPAVAVREGIASHDTLNDVMNALPAGLFAECFTAWVAGLRDAEPDIVAIDGKTSRRARRGDVHVLHLVSAWASRQRLVLGQQAVSEKSNEINAIPLLLDRLELTGALITIDANGCQRDIAEAIKASGADYLLALKDNWPTLAGEVRLFFDSQLQQAFRPAPDNRRRPWPHRGAKPSRQPRRRLARFRPPLSR